MIIFLTALFRGRPRLIESLFDSESSTYAQHFSENFPNCKINQANLFNDKRSRVNNNGEEIQYQGETGLDLQIEDRLFKVKFFYAPQITYGLVLGLDFMKKWCYCKLQKQHQAR